MALGFAIVDAHQHFWDPTRNYHPWLCDEPPIPFRYGDYRSLRRPYLPPDYRADAKPFEVSHSVYIETEWNPADFDGEMAYVDTLRREHGLPSVAIACAWLDRPEAPALLERHAARPFVRGVRHKPQAHREPGHPEPGGTTSAAWRAGFARLAPLGLHFELQTPWWHLHEAARLAADFEATPIVLNHTGLPADRSTEGLAAWRRAMATLAACPNVSVKISGIGVPGRPWTAAANRGVVLTTIELFGPGRCMFASNFPVDGLCGTFAEILAGFDEVTRGFSDAERLAMFRGNALRVYRIDEHGAPS
ncbi:MAG: amidohydrolase family protein [Rubrivivax sp.]|nr:amidohydrolase family protein [Rubrivivax sp.]